MSDMQTQIGYEASLSSPSTCECERKAPTLNDDELQALLDWRHSLERSPKECEQLRRSVSPATNSNLSCVEMLKREIASWDKEINPTIVPAVAGLLANVDSDDPDTRFICSLGTIRSGRKRPPLGEIHFLRLMGSIELADLYRRLRRAIILLGRSIDVASLVECVIAWGEIHLADSIDSDRRTELTRRWEQEYRGGSTAG